MIRVGIGIAHGTDGARVGELSARRALADCPSPKVALLFAHGALDQEALLSAVRSATGDAPVWGTTSPHLISTAGPAESGAVLLLVDSDALEFRLLSGRVKGAPRDAARYLASKYLHERPTTAADRVACLLVGTESHLRGIDYIRGLNDVFPFPPAVVGGSSVGKFPYERLEDLHRGAQYCGTYAGNDHLSLLFVRALDPARVRFGFAFESRYPPVAPPVVCTRTEGSAVFEVDGIPIVDYTKRFFGAGFITSINQIKERYTFSTLLTDGRVERSLFRAQNFDFARGCAVFWPDEEMAGKTIQLVHTSRAEVIESAGRGALAVRAALGGADPAFALAFDCVGRNRLLLSRAHEEIDQLVDGLGSGVPVAGFYTAGEFAPLLDRYESIVDRANPLSGSGQFGCTLSLFSVAETGEGLPAAPAGDLRSRLRGERAEDAACAGDCDARRIADLTAKLETAERTLTETEATISIISGELSATLLDERARRAELAEANAANDRLMSLLRRYTPRTVLDKAAVSVRAGLLDIPDEELHLAFLFMDIKGFTRYSETRPPDEVIAAINGLLGPATACVYRHGGDVDKFIGDCLFATFPSCDGALAAALEMQRQIAAHRQNGSPFDARVGINWGRVVSGNVGGVERCDNTLIGDAVNLAQRLESNCAPGKVLVSAAFFAKISENVKQGLAARAGRIAVKGKEAPVEVVEIDPAPPASPEA